MQLIKKKTHLLIAVLSALLISGCEAPAESSEDIRLQVRGLMDDLEVAVTRENEYDLITQLWTVAYEDPEIGLGLTVKDAEGNMVTANIPEGVLPLEATVSLSGEGWNERCTFTPLSVENLMIFLNE